MDVNSKEFLFLMRFFNHGKMENPRFFRRLGNPDIKGCDVLEVGCGTGSLAIYMVKELGAAHVLAIDIEKDNIAFAQANLAHNYPELAGRVEYRFLELTEQSLKGKYDCVVAKDMFEHVIQFKEFFETLYSTLKPGGRLLSGFGPLYESPRGGHAVTRFPFDHLIFSERYLIKRLNKRYNRDCKTIIEYGLNKLKLVDYLKVFNESGFRQDYIRMNQSDSVPGKIAAVFLKIPFFRWMTFNVYLIFSRPE